MKTYLVNKLESMSRVPMEFAVSKRNASISHQNHYLMDRLRILTQIVPEMEGVISVSEVCARITLLGMDEVRKLCRISQKEHRSVIKDPIHVLYAY